MNQPRTVEGRWWIFGDDKPAQLGTLTYDPETGLSLTVTVPQNRSGVREWVEAFRKLSNARTVQITERAAMAIGKQFLHVPFCVSLQL